MFEILFLHKDFLLRGQLDEGQESVKVLNHHLRHLVPLLHPFEQTVVQGLDVLVVSVLDAELPPGVGSGCLLVDSYKLQVAILLIAAVGGIGIFQLETNRRHFDVLVSNAAHDFIEGINHCFLRLLQSQSLSVHHNFEPDVRLGWGGEKFDEASQAFGSDLLIENT